MGLPYYNKYVGDYARDTRGLSLVEHGAYNLLLDDYYSNGCLEHSLEQCFRVCMAFEQVERDAVKSVLDKFFIPLPDGGYYHKRVEEEIAKQTKAYEARLLKSKRAANARWNPSSNAPSITSGSASGYANQNQNQNQNQNHYIPPEDDFL